MFTCLLFLSSMTSEFYPLSPAENPFILEVHEDEGHVFLIFVSPVSTEPKIISEKIIELVNIWYCEETQKKCNIVIKGLA